MSAIWHVTHYKPHRATFEDDRFSYNEQRFVTLGLLASIPVSIIHTEHPDEIRVISFRKATPSEANLYFETVGN